MNAAWWDWSDAWTFIGVFVGLRIAFIWLATQAIIALFPEGDTCVICGEHTLPLVHEGGWHLLGHRFHRRFCLSCNWEGIARSNGASVRTRTATPPRPHNSRSGRQSAPR